MGYPVFLAGYLLVLSPLAASGQCMSPARDAESARSIESGLRAAPPETTAQEIAQDTRLSCAPGITLLEPQSADQIRVVVASRSAFSPGSAELKDDFRVSLDSLSAVLVRYPGATASVTGHTNSLGLAEYNQLLSLRRAESVGEYLKGKGITPSRLRISGKSASEPIATNETVAGRAANERVEILIHTSGASTTAASERSSEGRH